jgi:hypothetical protein
MDADPRKATHRGTSRPTLHATRQAPGIGVITRTPLKRSSNGHPCCNGLGGFRDRCGIASNAAPIRTSRRVTGGFTMVKAYRDRSVASS